MRNAIVIVIALLLTACASPPVQAQAKGGLNWQARPTYETATLRAGFTPDPWSRQLQAGGPNQATSAGSGCSGYVNASAPDFDLNYTAGSLSLYIYATSDADTTIVVNAPDGRYYCNDDFMGLNPGVVFSSPQSGNYNIWVGVLGSTQLRPATLHISELNPQNRQVSGGGGSGAEPNWQATPTFTTVNLSAGFAPDPWTYNIQAGGGDQVSSNLGSGCRGFIHAAAPDIDLNYTSGSLPLHIHVESSSDTTLVVNDPHGNWHCNDDSIGLNPLVSFARPQSGNYNIWVGVYGSGTTTPAQVKITELNPRR